MRKLTQATPALPTQAEPGPAHAAPAVLLCARASGSTARHPLKRAVLPPAPTQGASLPMQQQHQLLQQLKEAQAREAAEFAAAQQGEGGGKRGTVRQCLQSAWMHSGVATVGWPPRSALSDAGACVCV